MVDAVMAHAKLLFLMLAAMYMAFFFVPHL